MGAIIIKVLFSFDEIILTYFNLVSMDLLSVITSFNNKKDNLV